MEEKSLIEKLKVVLGLVKIEEEVKLSEMTLADGTVVSCDKEMIEVGAMMTNADGTPLADGEYVLADGSKFTVVSGAVTEISAPETPAEPAKVEEAAVEVVSVDDFKALQTAVNELRDALMLSSQTLTETSSKLTKENEELKTANETLKVEFAKLAAQPATTPIKNKNIVPKEEENALRGLLKK